MAHVAVHTNGPQQKTALARRPPAPLRWMRSLFNWDPFQEMAPFFPSEEQMAFMPDFDIKETKEGYVFKTDVPGIKIADLDVSVSGRQLTVSGKRESEHEEKTDTYYACERSYGSFSRSFTLPQGADEKSVSADLKDGVLTISFQKKAEIKATKVEIKSGGTKH